MKTFITIFTLGLLITAASTLSAQVNWTKDSTNNPVLQPGLPGEWDELYVQHSAVVFDGNEYHMWYSASSTTTGGAIGHATSQDGIVWHKDSLNNPVLTQGSAGEWDGDLVGFLSVLYDGSIYHMWYTGGDKAQINRIGYATSTDGISWAKYDNPATNTNPFLFV